MTLYEIRRDGRVWVRSPIPDCGYSAQELRSLRAHGFRLHKVERKEKKSCSPSG